MRGALQHALDVHLQQRTGSQFDWTGAVYQLVSRIVQILAVGSVIALGFLWLQFALEQFPLTEPLGDRMGAFILGLLRQIGVSIVESIPGLVTVVVILLITRAIQRLVGNIFVAVQKGQITVPGMHPETAGATRRLASVLVWALGFTFAYPYIPGSQSDVFKGLSVLIGFMITLGSANIVNQVMSGMVVVYSRALRRGDMVSIGDTVGTVIGLDALSVKVVNLRNEEVTLPNAVVVGSAIHNFSRHSAARDPGSAGQGAMVSTAVTIGYDTPWRQVHAMLLEAAAHATHVVAAPTPFVLQRGLSDFYVEYELFTAIDNPRNRFFALSALHAAIQDVFNTHGVQIMSPHFIDQPGQSVVVPQAQLSSRHLAMPRWTRPRIRIAGPRGPETHGGRLRTYSCTWRAFQAPLDCLQNQPDHASVALPRCSSDFRRRHFWPLSSLVATGVMVPRMAARLPAPG